MNTDFTKVFDLAIEQNASDIHYQTGQKPVLRVAGKLLVVEDAKVFDLKESSPEFKEFLNENQHQY